MNPRIFISYKRKDKDKVFALKDRIEKETGQKCWIDLDGIESDAQFKGVIIKAINNCEIVLFMYSKLHGMINDFDNDWTFRELNFASAKGKRIVFINIDGSTLSDAFAFDYGTKQQVDGRSEEAMRRLFNDIKKWLRHSSEILPPPFIPNNSKPQVDFEFIPPLYISNDSKPQAHHKNTNGTVDVAHNKQKTAIKPSKTGKIIMWSIISLSLLFCVYGIIMGSDVFRYSSDVSILSTFLIILLITVGFSNPSLLLLRKRKEVTWYLLALFFFFMATGIMIDAEESSEFEDVETEYYITE